MPNGSSETVESAFSTFVDKIFKVLKKEDSFKKVRRKCIENVNVTGVISLPPSTLSEIDNTEDFDELFDVLCHCRSYWNWMNIRLLERMVGDCLPAKELINQYKNETFSRKVKDIVSEIPILEIPSETYTEVKDKWNKDFDDLTIKDIVKRWSEIETRFNVDETMLLKSITHGCVEVCWLLPNDLVECAVSSATKSQSINHNDQSDTGTQEFLHELLYLKIGDHVIKDGITGKQCIIYTLVLCLIYRKFLRVKNFEVE